MMEISNYSIFFYAWLLVSQLQIYLLLSIIAIYSIQDDAQDVFRISRDWC